MRLRLGSVAKNAFPFDELKLWHRSGAGTDGKRGHARRPFGSVQSLTRLVQRGRVAAAILDEERPAAQDTKIAIPVRLEPPALSQVFYRENVPHKNLT
jgi:hypothetical protein